MFIKTVVTDFLLKQTAGGARFYSMMMLRLLLPFALLTQCLLAQEEIVQHKGHTFQIYRANPKGVKIAWKDEAGKILHSLQAGKRHFEKNGTVRLLTNGGIFEPGCIPRGLHVEGGKIIRPLNLENGKGNFFLKPNGVFLIDQTGKAQVLESRKLAQSPLLKANQIRLATQSGPLLLEKGTIHPAFREHSKNRLHRNGVGVDEKGQVVFAITDDQSKGYCNL